MSTSSSGTSINGQTGTLGLFGSTGSQYMGTYDGINVQDLMNVDLSEYQSLEVPYQNEESNDQSLIKDWQSLQSTMSDLTTSTQTLSQLSLNQKSATLSDSTVANVSADSTAQNGSYTLSVSSVAAAQKIMSNSVSDTTDPLGYNDTVTINGQNLYITGNMSLTDIANTINSGNYNVNAVIIGGHLVLTSAQTGTANAMTLSDAGTGSSASSSNAQAVSAEATGTPASGTNSYQVDVTALATAQSDASNAVTDPTAQLGYSGTFTLNNQTFTVAATDSVNDIINMINSNTSTGVTASLSASGQMVLTGSTGSANAFSLSDATTSSTNSAQTLFQSIGMTNSSNAFANQTSSAQNASYTVNGTAYSSATNTDTTAISGVTLQLSSVTSSAVTITVNGGNQSVLQDLGILNSSNQIENQIQAAADASYSIDNIAMTSSSNFITSALPGVTLQLQNTTAAPVTMTIADDTSSIQSAVDDFVSKFNAAINAINQDTAQGAPLQGQNTVNQAKNTMDNAITLINQGTQLQLYQIGITMDDNAKDGTIKINDNTLSQELESNPDQVIALLSGTSGVMNQLYTQLNQISGSTGSINDEITTLNTDVTNLTTKLSTMQTQYQQEEQTLLQKYSNFQTTMMSLSSESQYITAMTNSMSGSSKSGG